MIARITLDVVQGPSSPIVLVLVGLLVVAILLEGGILALMGMRPVGKAFTNSFLVNIAAVATFFVVWVITAAAGLPDGAMLISVPLGVILVQGLVLSANRVNLTKGRAWAAAVVMKVCSFLLLIAFLKLTNY
jgi:hypothetical protein